MGFIRWGRNRHMFSRFYDRQVVNKNDLNWLAIWVIDLDDLDTVSSPGGNKSRVYVDVCHTILYGKH